VRKLRFFAAALTALSIATPATAEWREAKTRHFVVYSELPAADLKTYLSRLEQFDGVMRELQGLSDPDPTPSSRPVIYMVKSVEDVQRLINDKQGIIAGFYRPQVEGTLAVVPQNGTNWGEWSLKADSIFFHEYTHHLMLQKLDTVYPKWMVEGWAEFFATVQFEKDGNVRFGRPADHRMYELVYGTKLTYDRLLANEPIKSSDPTSTSIYGRSWIMSHYFFFNPERLKQLMEYLTLINSGTDGRAAARQAFGNLQKLNGEIESYYRKPALPFSRFPASKYAPKSIEMRQLRPGEAAVIEARMQSKVGVDRERGAQVLKDIQRVAAQYPNEPLILSSLAEAEIDMQNYSAAIAASDRALAIDPRWTEAMIFKGRAIAEDPANKGKAELFSKARSLFVAANKIDTEDPEPLKLYWDSFRRQGVAPTAAAIAGLHYASRLVPQDMDMRMLSALQYLRDEHPAEARERLATIAFNPHSGPTADKAQEMVDKIDAKDPTAALAIVEDMLRKADEARAKAAAAK
jgi:hypothetical protein